MSSWIIVIPVNSLWYYLNAKNWREEGLTDNSTKFNSEKEAQIPLVRIKRKHPKAYIKKVK